MIDEGRAEAKASGIPMEHYPLPSKLLSASRFIRLNPQLRDQFPGLLYESRDMTAGTATEGEISSRQRSPPLWKRCGIGSCSDNWELGF